MSFQAAMTKPMQQAILHLLKLARAPQSER
jgi:hypothetical protein